MNDYEVLASTWWTPIRRPTGAPQGTSIGAVAIQTHNGKWKAYIGYGEGWNQLSDEQNIAGHGTKVSKEEAAGMFPQLKIEDFVF